MEVLGHVAGAADGAWEGEGDGQEGRCEAGEGDHGSWVAWLAGGCGSKGTAGGDEEEGGIAPGGCPSCMCMGDMGGRGKMAEGWIVLGWEGCCSFIT